MNVSRILKYMFSDWQSGDWELVDRRGGNGTVISAWNRSETQPTPAEIAAQEDAAEAAAIKVELKAYASLKGFLFATTYINPLTGSPISSATDRAGVEHDLVKAESYWYAAYDTATDAVKLQIDAALAERKRMPVVTLAIHADIDSGTITTQSQIENDSRWTD